MELIEKTSIPAAMDILGLYEALMDREGNLLSFDRKGLRHRGDKPKPEEDDHEQRAASGSCDAAHNPRPQKAYRALSRIIARGPSFH